MAIPDSVVRTPPLVVTEVRSKDVETSCSTVDEFVHEKVDPAEVFEVSLSVPVGGGGSGIPPGQMVTTDVSEIVIIMGSDVPLDKMSEDLVLVEVNSCDEFRDVMIPEMAEDGVQDTVGELTTGVDREISTGMVIVVKTSVDDVSVSEITTGDVGTLLPEVTRDVPDG